MNILIIEDDVFLAEKIGNVFRSKVISNRIRTVHSFQEFCEELAVISSYDIVLTDLKLSEDHRNPLGYEVIRSIRNKGSTIPIVVISGFSEIEKLRLAFEYGANDYIIKPIRLKELEIRVFNWFKNYYFSGISSGEKVSEYEGLRYDINQNEFYFQDQHIPLTKNNKYLLSLFFSEPGKLLTESFLNEKVWGDICSAVNRNLRVNILRLKRSLASFGIHEWIENVRGEWYIFLKR